MNKRNSETGRRRHRSIRRSGPSDRPCLRQTRRQRRPARSRCGGTRGGRGGGRVVRRHGDSCVPTDVADPDQVEAAAEAVEERFGPIDVWVNDAMATVFAPFAEITAEEFTRATEVTYLGTVYGTMAALKRMVPRNRGTVVQVGSALAYRAIPLAVGLLRRRSSRSAASPTRCAPSCSTTRAASGSRWCSCRRVNTPQFNWCRSEAAQPPATGAADLPAGGARRGGVLGGAPPPPRDHGGRTARSRRSSATSSRPASPTGTWRAPGTPPSRSRTCRSTPTGRTTSSSRSRALAATHGMFDDQAKPRSYQLWATTHRRPARRRRRRRATRSRRAALGASDERECGPRRGSIHTSCASTRCSPTASAASSSGRAATSRGCASHAGTMTPCSRR